MAVEGVDTTARIGLIFLSDLLMSHPPFDSVNTEQTRSSLFSEFVSVATEPQRLKAFDDVPKYLSSVYNLL